MQRIHLRATVVALSLSAFVVAAACSSANEYSPGGGGGPVCGTCADIYTNGGIVCGPGSSSDAWEALALCACGGKPVGDAGTIQPSPCESACYASFCDSLPADMGCGACVASKCSAQVSSCGGN